MLLTNHITFRAKTIAAIAFTRTDGISLSSPRSSHRTGDYDRCGDFSGCAFDVRYLDNNENNPDVEVPDVTVGFYGVVIGPGCGAEIHPFLPAGICGDG